MLAALATHFRHSWGGMLAYEYGVRYPDHLHRLIISNMVPSSEAYDPYINLIRERNTPYNILQKMLDYEAKEDFENEEYQQLMTEHFFEKYICKLVPWPEPLTRSFTQNNDDIYSYFQGPNEMVC